MKKLFLLLMAVITLSLSASAQTRTVTGTVYEAGTDEPLIGATVKAGTGYAVTTDADGQFVIKLPESIKNLEVSYVGYKTQTVPVKSGKLTIYLSTANELLDEVIAVAYGSQKKSSFTGSAAVVGAAEIENAQVSNPLNALKGKVAGVQMSNASGAPGADSPEILIRGISSISAGVDPLIIVDGTPFAGSMNTLNSADIESMTILKDAASNALYGARGANGVILITTKRAKNGEARVTVDVKLGSNSRAQRDYDYIKNPAMYYETYYKALYNYSRYQGNSHENANAWANRNMISGSGYGLQYNVYNVPNGQALIGLNGKLNPNATLGNVVSYNGQDYLLTPDNWTDAAYHNSLRQEYNFSVAKGSDNGNFYLSAGYLDNAGITPASGFSRFTGRLSADTQAKPWLKVAGNLSYTHYDRDQYGREEGASGSSGNPFAFVSNVAPIYPLYVRDGQGNIMKDDHGNTIYDYGTPNEWYTNAGLARPVLGGNANGIGSSYYDKATLSGNAVSASGSVEVRFLNDFRITSNNSVDYLATRSTSFTNPYFGQNHDENGMLSKTSSESINYTFQQLINWSHKFGNHNVALLAGHETYWQRSKSLTGRKSNMFDPSNMELAGMITEVGASSSASDYNNEGWIFRAQYDYMDKAFLSASYRRDASSRFHPKHRWGNFWSAGGAWIISKENFLKDQTWINILKIKASYGEQGNDNIGNPLYVNTYEIVNSNGQASVVPYTMGNENITWETNGNFNAGVEFALFNNRLSGSVEGFFRNTSDMLFYFPLPPSMGWSGYYANIGDMSNRGFEIDLHGTLVQTSDFTWDINANFTWYKNRITRLPEERRTSVAEGYEGYQNDDYFYGEGLSLYTIYMPKYAGVEKDTGLPMWYYDKTETLPDGSTVTTQETTTQYSRATQYLCGTALAPMYGGFGTSFQYKWFDLSVDFNYQIGGQTYDSAYASLMGSPSADGGIGNNIHADILKAWTPENPNSDIPRFQYGDQYNSRSSDRFLTNASYLSLSNITFGFTLPEKTAKKLFLQSCRLYLNCDNVWLWSKRQGLDPRMSYSGASGNSSYSPIRTISGGLNITF